MLKNYALCALAIQKVHPINFSWLKYFKPIYGFKTLYISIYGGNIRMMISKMKLIESIDHQ